MSKSYVKAHKSEIDFAVLESKGVLAPQHNLTKVFYAREEVMKFVGPYLQYVLEVWKKRNSVPESNSLIDDLTF